MESIEFRVKGPADLICRYKGYCVKKRLSIPKQTMELMKKFLEIHEENDRIMENIKKKEIK